VSPLPEYWSRPAGVKGTALRADAAIPLPAAISLSASPHGSAAKALAVPERQLIAEVALNLVLEIVGRRSF